MSLAPAAAFNAEGKQTALAGAGMQARASKLPFSVPHSSKSEPMWIVPIGSA